MYSTLVFLSLFNKFNPSISQRNQQNRSNFSANESQCLPVTAINCVKVKHFLFMKLHCVIYLHVSAVITVMKVKQHER